MPYQLRDGLTCCQVDGTVIFLDAYTDRYFRLSSRLQRAFIACSRGQSIPDVEVAELIHWGIPIFHRSASAREPHDLVQAPTCSASERPDNSAHPGLATVAEVFTTVVSTRLQLANRRLINVLSSTKAYRASRSTRPEARLGKENERRLAEAAHLFSHARAYVPIQPLCLLDSLALSRFLSRRNLYADVVIGVTGDPFAAHAWVQAADLVLNDTVGNANAYTPIRVM